MTEAWQHGRLSDGSRIVADTDTGEYRTRDLLLAAGQRIRTLEEALREAEGFIAGALPRFAQDRRDAVERVLPIIRAALASSSNAGVKGGSDGPSL